jgi:hypothetical protein
MRAVADGKDLDVKAFQEGIRTVFSSDDAKEGATAFAERRPAVWTGR